MRTGPVAVTGAGCLVAGKPSIVGIRRVDNGIRGHIALSVLNARTAGGGRIALSPPPIPCRNVAKRPSDEEKG